MNIDLPNPLLVSILNTKLRNDYDSLNMLCEDLDIDYQVLIERLSRDGYFYDEELNQFRSL